MTVRSESPSTTVSPSATIVTVLPSASTTLPPSATLSADTVESAVTTQVEPSSTLTVTGASEVEPAAFSSIEAAPVQVESSSR